MLGEGGHLRTEKKHQKPNDSIQKEFQSYAYTGVPGSFRIMV